MHLSDRGSNSINSSPTESALHAFASIAAWYLTCTPDSKRAQINTLPSSLSLPYFALLVSVLSLQQGEDAFVPGRILDAIWPSALEQSTLDAGGARAFCSMLSTCGPIFD